MPEGAQLLYFHMVQRADDDGVVESYPLMKLLGSAPDNFKVLAAKGFIQQLNEDQVIVIADWLEHNVIRADRKVNSIYKHLLDKVAPDVPRIDPKPRSDVEDNSARVGGQSTDGIGKVRLGKDSIGKETKTITVANAPGGDVQAFIALFGGINPSYGELFKRTNQRAAATRLLSAHDIEWWRRFMEAYVSKIDDRYCPKATTPAQMEDKLGAILAYAKSQKTTTNVKFI